MCACILTDTRSQAKFVKMVFLYDAGLKNGRLYTQGLMMLVIAYLSLSIGQQGIIHSNSAHWLS